MHRKTNSSVAALFSAAFAALLTASCAPNVSPRSAANAEVIDRVTVNKAAHKMSVYSNGKPLRVFDVALGIGGLKPKERQGDGRVPEGEYFIAGRNPNSAYHLALLISYPTPEQVDVAKFNGVDPGGEIMIHGLPNGQAGIGSAHRRVDWTLGCIAVTNEEIEWLWERVPDGTTIEIRP